MFIVSHEGIVLSRYFDTKGVATIGIGHTAAAGYPDPKTFVGSFTLSEAFGLFHQDILKYERAVNAAVTVPLAQHEFDALVSFHYNTGAIGRASFVKRLNAGDRAGAMKGMMDWRKPPEILRRRTAERNLFRDGTYPAPYATVFPADASGHVLWDKGKRVDLREELAPKPAPQKPAESVQPSEPVVVAPKPEVVSAPVPMPPVGDPWWMKLLKAILALFSRR